jgi:putative ABC transport system permease protein
VATLSSLANGFWKRKFSGDPKIVGTPISLSGDPYIVVLDSKFETDPVSDMWLPFQFDPNSQN